MKRYPVITEVDMPTKDTEYSITIPKDAKSYTVKTRGNHAFRIAYKTGQVEAATGEFMTIPAGSAESEDSIGREDPVVLYVSCESDGEKLEVKIWR